MHLNNGFPVIPLIVGEIFILEDLDPHWALQAPAHDVINHICEGLFRYNLTHPSHEIIPHLASGDGLWSLDGLNITITLHEGITFHDGYKFNASAVKWSFDRLAYLMNITGDLPDTCFYGMPTLLRIIYEWPDGTPIINRTEVHNKYLIRFVLNRPYGAFKTLLCFPGSYIVSPLSTPATDYIDPDNDNLVGTGLFIFNGWTPFELSLHAYENYWRGKAHIDQIIFRTIQDTDERHNALLNGNIHFLEEVDLSYINIFKANSNLTVLDSGKTGTIPMYLGMNNKLINKTWRQTISYAVNYNYIIENLMYGQATRLKSPLPEGILFANSSFNYPIFNVTKAREIIQNMGFGEEWDPMFPGINEAQWISASFRTFNFTYLIGDPYREELFVLIVDNLAKIGVTVSDAGMYWEDFADRLNNRSKISAGWDALQLYSQSFLPISKDPSNYINHLMSNTSASNSAQINDAYLQTLIDQGLEEFDPLARKAIYDEIQRYLVEDLMPYAWLHVDNLCTAHHKNLTGFQQNGLDILDFYSCEWNPYNFKIQINSPAAINFVKGALGNNIIWTLSAEHLLNPAYNITVNGILNRTGLWQSGVPIVVNLDHLAPGTYTYEITAKNENEIVQDTVIVNVNAKTEEDGFTILLITIGAASGVGLAVIITILVMRKRRK